MASKYWLGKHHSEETKKKISLAKTGRRLSEEQKKKLSLIFKGKIFSEETRRKISEAKTGKPRPDMVGENNPNWKNGKTIGRIKDMQSIEYKQWRSAVFKRDNYTCQECGRKRVKGDRVLLEAHHIKPYSLFVEYRYVLSNGLTLCRECHDKTKSSVKVFN